MEFEKAIETNTLEDWIAYWKRCRLLVIRYDRDAIDDPDNLNAEKKLLHFKV